MNITVIIAQRPEFRAEPLYIALALLCVASSWVLLAFSFAQGYARLDSTGAPGSQLRFRFPDQPRLVDYITFAILISTMAATTPAEVVSRPAWRLVRTNVIIAFVFNSVIIAMMVSVLFGGLLA